MKPVYSHEDAPQGFAGPMRGLVSYLARRGLTWVVHVDVRAWYARVGDGPRGIGWDSLSALRDAESRWHAVQP